jgi:integrase
VSGRRDFGSVRKLPSGKWQATYWHNGQRHAAPQTFTAKADATAYLSTVHASILKGLWLDPAAGKVTFSDYAQGWLSRRTDLRPTTRAKYASLLKLHLSPTLGTVDLGKLSPSLVRSWYHELAGRFPVVADDAYRLLRAICNTAADDGAMGRSPCQVKGAGQVRSPERPTATVAEVAKAVQETPERYRLAILLAAFCQLRRGEVLGLQRRDVDVLHGTLKVERAWVPPMTGAPVLGPPQDPRRGPHHQHPVQRPAGAGGPPRAVRELPTGRLGIPHLDGNRALPPESHPSMDQGPGEGRQTRPAPT